MSVIVSVGSVGYALATWERAQPRAGSWRSAPSGCSRRRSSGCCRSSGSSAATAGGSPSSSPGRSADVLIIAACAALDGGTHSPYILFLVLPFLFASLTYPVRGTVAGRRRHRPRRPRGLARRSAAASPTAAWAPSRCSASPSSAPGKPATRPRCAPSWPAPPRRCARARRRAGSRPSSSARSPASASSPWAAPTPTRSRPRRRELLARALEVDIAAVLEAAARGRRVR